MATITYDTVRSERISRNLCILPGKIAFDASYPYGGESMSGLAGYFKGTVSSELVVLFEQAEGLTFQWDRTNNKVQAFAPAPPLVFEAKHTASSKAVTLDYPAAWIVNVCTAGQNEELQAISDTVSDNECQLTSLIAQGTRTGITTFGASDVIYVTYATQAWRELYMLLQQEEAVTLATGSVALTYAPMAFGYCFAATTGSLIPVDNADTTATGEVGVDFTVAAGAGTAALDIHSGQDAETAKVTYLEKPAATTWIGSRLVEDEDPAKAGSDPYTQMYDFPLLMWNITGSHTVTGGTTLTIIESGVAAATGEINCLDWQYGGYDLLAGAGGAIAAGHGWGAKDNVSTTAGCYLKGHPCEIPGLVPLEVKDTTDLSHATARFIAIGLK